MEAGQVPEVDGKNGGELRTPPRGAPPVFDEEGYTPPCVPVPTSKKVLVAAKKLEKELRQMKSNPHAVAKVPKDSAVPKSQSSKSKPKPPPSSSKQLKKSRARKPHDGPMTSAMKDFIQEKVNGGKSYRKAQRQWLKSSERASIVARLSASECKRRRYY